MTAPTDVLESGAARPRRPVLLPLVLAAAVGAGAAVAVRDDTADVQDVSGTMVVDVEYQRAEQLERSELHEDRSGIITGSLELALPDTTVTGQVAGTTSFSMLPTATGPVVLHAWGALTVSLPTTSCTGSYAYSYYYEPAEAGGTVELRCEDGSLLGARMAPTTYDPPDGQRPWWRTTLRLDDGWTTLRP